MLRLKGSMNNDHDAELDSIDDAVIQPNFGAFASFVAEELLLHD